MPPGIGYPPNPWQMPQMDNRMGMGGDFGFGPGAISSPTPRPGGFTGGANRFLQQRPGGFNMGGFSAAGASAQKPGPTPFGLRDMARRTFDRIRPQLPVGHPGYTPGPGDIPGNLPGNRGVPSFEELLRRMQSGAIDVNEMNQLIRAVIGGRTAEGTIFDPRGTAASQEARRAESGRISNALQRRNKLMQASRPGLDPSQRGFADFWSDIGIQGGLARSGQDYYNQQATAYDDFLRSLLGGQLGYGFDLGRAEVDRRNQQSLQPPSPGGSVSVGPIGWSW